MREQGRLVFLGVALAAALQACGGNPAASSCPAGMTGTPPNCQPTPPPCTQTSVYQDSGPLPPRTLVYDDFSVPDSGRLDVTLDWTFPASRVGFYLVPANTCNTIEEFNTRSCNFLIRSEPSSVKPRRLSLANFNAGNYRWLTGTFGDEAESGSLQIVLSKGNGCPALASASSVASAPKGQELPELERLIRR
jgi:hypothetical protein